MKYQSQALRFSLEQRRMLNEKVIYLLDSQSCNQYGITGDDIFNAYTGIGGLHGLSQEDFNNYYEYSEQKKLFEIGQFFTPPKLCELVMACLRLSEYDLVADLTCGMENFFNYVPVETNAYGCELDLNAYKVARYLYPQANLVHGDIRAYQPGVRFDYVVDFISFVLIDFPVFNVADCFIVVATILLFLVFLFVLKEEDLAFLKLSRQSERE